MGSYKNCNIIELTTKSITFEGFDEIHKVVLDRISERMASLVQAGMYGAINKSDNTKNGLLLLNQSQRHTRYKIIKKLMEKIFLIMN